MKTVLALLIALSAGGPCSAAQSPSSAAATGSYVLGPDDEITIQGVGIEEISDKPARIDMSGHIRLPLIGQFKASGMNVTQLQAALVERLKLYVLDPEISVSVTQFRSQPVSVLGSVRNPGVYQLQGRKTLIEVLSLAGGLDRETAGSNLKITRRLESGPLPLQGAAKDATGEYTTAEVDLKSILEAEHPAANIALRPHDIITVPRADLIYVVGQVSRSGGFPLNERKGMTVLEALSQAGGMQGVAAPQHSRILRKKGNSADRIELAVNLKKILSGQAPDVPLQPYDILFIPSSVPKRAALRAVEAAINMSTGVLIWGR